MQSFNETEPEDMVQNTVKQQDMRLHRPQTLLPLPPMYLSEYFTSGASLWSF